ncbi:preprotein translocase subunit SecE [Candidatus Parcubacteria bacterium]|nr:MAG: preprotein translocase subunit SecE [Candidatus Parcubacteria bacterium]
MAKATERTSGNAVTRYFREVRAELAKVTWPSREEAINLTVVVLAVTIALSLFLGAWDYLFSRLIAFLIQQF